jgi:hypothetical protein
MKCVTRRTGRGTDVEILWSAGKPQVGLGRVATGTTDIGLIREVDSRWIATTPDGLDVELPGRHANERLAIERLILEAR